MPRRQEQFSIAIARDPSRTPRVYRARRRPRVRRSNLEGAAEDYLNAVKLEPPELGGESTGSATVLVALHKPDLGKRYLQRAVDLDPERATRGPRRG